MISCHKQFAGEGKNKGAGKERDRGTGEAQINRRDSNYKKARGKKNEKED